MADDWLKGLLEAVSEAVDGKRPFPVIFSGFSHRLSLEEVLLACREVLNVKAGLGTEYAVCYDQAGDCGLFTVRAPYDPNPPPFLEKHPIRLVGIMPG